MSVKPDMSLFSYEHLPEKLQRISMPVGKLAQWMEAELPEGTEKDVALRKLLEAKDAAVRAALTGEGK